MSNATEKTEKFKALKLTMDKIDKDFGKGSVMMMNEKTNMEIETIEQRFRHRRQPGHKF